MIDTGGTLVQGAKALMEHGARRVLCAATHPILSGPAISRINESCLEKVMVSDTIPLTSAGRACAKVEVLSVANLFGEAIKRIHDQDSVSSLFE
jgi:ribose-phosphate pyrophosphokinase